MKLEQQVCSLDLSKKLKELGVVQESALFVWVNRADADHPFNWCIRSIEEYEPYFQSIDKKAATKCIFTAFTVAELGIALGRNANDVSWNRTSTQTHREGLAYA